MEISIKPSYLIIPVIALITFFVGQLFVSAGMSWYHTLHLPSFTPPSWIFSTVWTIIFLFTTVAALIVWQTFERDRHFWFIIALFVLNALFNILWSYLFFVKQSMGMASVDAFLVFLTSFGLLIEVSRRSLLVASLLIVYPAWSLFATFLNLIIVVMNR